MKWYVSDDLKHDAHLVNKYTQVTVDVLKKKKVEICKIVEFMDQAPSKYKNETAFRYLGQSKIPTMRNFYEMRHGKCPFDAYTGRMKQGITRLVISGTKVVNSAVSFYQIAKKHLETDPVPFDKCQHL